jgi:tRNA(Ile)-lysidine synthase
VASTVRRRRLLAGTDVVLVALSAGADSTALLAAMAALRDAGQLARVFALHVDHGLRPGGEEDAECARDSCAVLGVTFRSVRVSVGRGNVQEAARRVRYRALREEAARVGATRIATGHTLTDQAETFLMRALRGAGARGLASIPPRRGPIVRPLIDVGRDEVVEFLRSRGLRWREDPSNASLRFTRNAVRHDLVPILRRIEPAFERALARAADLLRDDERALRTTAAALVDGRTIDLGRLLGASRAVRRRAVRLAWRDASRGARPLPAARVEAILALCRRDRPGALSLPGGIEARAAYGTLTLGPPARGEPPPSEVEVAGPGSYRFGSFVVDVAVDGEAGRDPVPWPLVLRGRRPGDRFRPERARGGKKLKAWLIDRKVPQARRDRLIVLADAHGTVLALPELEVRSSAAGALRVTARPAEAGEGRPSGAVLQRGGRAAINREPTLTPRLRREGS